MRDRGGHSSWIELSAVLVVAAALGALVLATPELHDAARAAIAGDTEGLRGELRGQGAGGAGVLFVLMLVHVVVWYPSEIVTAAAGFLYGFWAALPFVLAGWLVSALGSYALGGVKRRTEGERGVSCRSCSLSEQEDHLVADGQRWLRKGR